MARDIEEFLRKAAERRQQQKGGGAPKQPPRQQPPQQQQPPRQQPPRQQPPRQQPPRQQPPRQSVIVDDVEIVQRRPVVQPKQPQQRPPQKKHSLRSGSVADHVTSHINTSDIAAHAEQLGDRISNVHDQVESRIHQRLDRDLTALDDTASITNQPSPAIFGAKSTRAADDLRKMLSDPKSVGQAILVAEILKRPNI